MVLNSKATHEQPAMALYNVSILPIKSIVNKKYILINLKLILNTLKVLITYVVVSREQSGSLVLTHYTLPTSGEVQEDCLDPDMGNCLLACHNLVPCPDSVAVYTHSDIQQQTVLAGYLKYIQFINSISSQ